METFMNRLTDAHKAMMAELVNNPVLWEQWLAQLLTTYKQQIETWIDTGEGAVFDSFLVILGSKAPFLAALLTQYKAVLNAATDQEVSALIDALIAKLQGQ
jgi:hypothetical protein